MKKLALLAGLMLCVGILGSGCQTTQNHIPKSKDDFSLFGGLVATKKGAFEKMGPTKYSEKVSRISREPDYDGDRISFLWGLITFVDE